MMQPLGLLIVPVPGTIVRASANVTQNAQGVVNNPERFMCHAVLFQAWKGNVGNVYVGGINMNRSTGVGVAAVLAVPTVNAIPSFGISLTLAPAGINLSDLYSDADTPNDGCLISVLVT